MVYTENTKSSDYRLIFRRQVIQVNKWYEIEGLFLHWKHLIVLFRLLQKMKYALSSLESREMVSKTFFPNQISKAFFLRKKFNG